MINTFSTYKLLASAICGTARRCSLHHSAGQPDLLHKTLVAASGHYLPIYTIQGHNFGQAPPLSCRHLATTNWASLAPSKLSSGCGEPATGGGASSPAASVFDDSSSDHLPSLPVPALGDTLERLKETIWPIAMNSAEFAGALELIERFAQTAGPKLELLLRAKASQTKNWITHDWWTEEAYLKSRAPLVINSNPSMVFPQLPFQVDNQRQLISLVARLVSALIEFKFALQQGYNPEASNESDEFRLDANLCYSQYRHIFGSTRIAGQPMDELRAGVAQTIGGPYSFVLSFRGQFYEICLAAEANEHEESRLDTLTSLLNKLFDQTQAPQQPLGVGLLTSCARDQWARARLLLDEEPLGCLERAQFLLCLDSINWAGAQAAWQDAGLMSGPVVERFAEQLLGAPPGSGAHFEALSRQCLHADRANISNRWFDKSLQLIVVADETMERLLGAGINYEHSIAEGQVVAKMIEFAHDKLVAGHNRRGSGGGGGGAAICERATALGSLKPLRFERAGCEAQLDEELRRAQRDYAALVDQFDLAYFKHSAYGSNAIKSWRFSPDSWFQLALQLAHFRLHKRLGPCYESASTRRFAFGRTETIRSLTKDVAEFCQAPSLATMRAAVHSHKSYANAANNAAAIDRVLMGYRLAFNELRSGAWAWGVPAEQQKQQQQQRLEQPTTDLAEQLFSESELETLAAFFNNQLIERSKKFALSTSQVHSIHPDICMSYGPYLTDGYGCCYNITGQQIVAAITANSQNLSFSCQVDKFSESLSEALDEMRALVECELQEKRTS